MIAMGLEPVFLTGHPAAHPVESRTRRGSCRMAHVFLLPTHPAFEEVVYDAVYRAGRSQTLY